MTKAQLGVCYYPEHWPEAWWPQDAARMRDVGIDYVRIGEFAWSRLEPQPGIYQFDWLDRAIDVLGRAGLKVVLGTPTATPPKWLMDRLPGAYALDRDGRKRGFGSRRHYSFSAEDYARECDRIVEQVAQRYGRNPHVAAWQTDNEYGCHDTIRCYAPVSRDAFRRWLKQRYGTVAKLNEAWGNVFWSMEYTSFDEVELPNLTTTEANPSQWLDFYRFSSDQVVAFNRRQVDIIRRYSDRPISHNYMGFITEFDHYKVADDLEIATWDSYPLGFTDTLLRLSAADRRHWQRTGHPDIAPFHHDLYRAVGRGRWWVMEQQPGPVNWAFHNPAPLPGMVRLWTWEAFAHGAEVVSYFRWRQAPFAQEQMHAGLLRPDSVEAPGYFEAKQVAEEAARLDLPDTPPAPVALLFDYEAEWLLTAQPQGREYSFKHVMFAWYTALRRLGLDVDFIHPGAARGADLTGYRMIVAPASPLLDQATRDALRRAVAAGVHLVTGPRFGAKTQTLQIPDGLPPGDLRDITGYTVTRVESLDPEFTEPVSWNGQTYQGFGWREDISGPAQVTARCADAWPALSQHGAVHTAHMLLDEPFLMDWLAGIAAQAGLSTVRLPRDIRVRRRGGLTFAFNYGTEPYALPQSLTGDRPEFLLGGALLAPQEVALWR